MRFSTALVHQGADASLLPRRGRGARRRRFHQLAPGGAAGPAGALQRPASFAGARRDARRGGRRAPCGSHRVCGRQTTMARKLIRVPARRISEGAAPCPYCLAPCPIYPALCPNYLLKFFIYFFVQHFYFFYLQNVIAVFVFSDKMLVNACRFVPMFSSIAHKIVPRPRFVRVLDCDRILVVHA